MIHFKWLLFYVEYIMRWKWNSTLISSVKCPKNQTQKLPYSIKCSTEGQVLPKAISQFNQINKQASVMDTNANWSLQPLWDYCSFLYSYIYDVFANAISSSNNRKSHLNYLLFFSCVRSVWFGSFCTIQSDLVLHFLFQRENFINNPNCEVLGSRRAHSFRQLNYMLSVCLVIILPQRRWVNTRHNYLMDRNVSVKITSVEIMFDSLKLGEFFHIIFQFFYLPTIDKFSIHSVNNFI